ncbi:MAG: hypothetical protein HRU12_02770 [Phaeodactylibacter sp.]|nr:hypothetical protein [Phaeodactylibacter sp.]
MAKKRIKGRNMRAQLSTDSGTTYQLLTDEQSFDLTITTQFEEISSKDSCGNIERIPTRNEWNCSLTGYLVTDAASPADRLETDEILPLQSAQTLLDVRFVEWDCAGNAALSGGLVLTGQCYISSTAISAADGEPGTLTMDIQGTGELTQSTTP